MSASVFSKRPDRYEIVALPVERKPGCLAVNPTLVDIVFRETLGQILAEGVQLGGEAGYQRVINGLRTMVKLRMSIGGAKVSSENRQTLGQLIETAAGKMFEVVVRETAADLDLPCDLVRKAFDEPRPDDGPEVTAAREKLIQYFSCSSRLEGRAAVSKDV